jgi:hypothetical protein
MTSLLQSLISVSCTGEDLLMDVGRTEQSEVRQCTGRCCSHCLPRPARHAHPFMADVRVELGRGIPGKAPRVVRILPAASEHHRLIAGFGAPEQDTSGKLKLQPSGTTTGSRRVRKKVSGTLETPLNQWRRAAFQNSSAIGEPPSTTKRGRPW